MSYHYKKSLSVGNSTGSCCVGKDHVQKHIHYGYKSKIYVNYKYIILFAQTPVTDSTQPFVWFGRIAQESCFKWQNGSCYRWVGIHLEFRYNRILD